MNFVDLLENYLILKERDKDLYYDVKDNIDKYKSFIYDNLAYDIIIKDDFIKYSLDYEEKARIDIEDDGTMLFIVDIPIIEKENDSEIYTTMPIGMIVVRDDYFITVSLKNNSIIKGGFVMIELGVMEKTLRGKIIKLYDEDEDILEDAIIENKQAIEMSKIYSDILNGTMDAYASIISNNLNGVMKFLTSITIILSIPTMVASFWGMNVEVPMQNNKLGFLIIMIFSVLSAIIAMIWLKKKDMLD